MPRRDRGKGSVRGPQHTLTCPVPRSSSVVHSSGSVRTLCMEVHVLAAAFRFVCTGNANSGPCSVPSTPVRLRWPGAWVGAGSTVSLYQQWIPVAPHPMPRPQC